MKNSFEFGRSGLRESDLKDRVISILRSELQEKKSQVVGEPLSIVAPRRFVYGSGSQKESVYISDYQFLRMGDEYIMAVLLRDSFQIDSFRERVSGLYTFEETEEVFEFFREQLAEGFFSTESLFEEREFGGVDQYFNGRRTIDRYTPFYIDISDPVDIEGICSMTQQLGRDIIVLEDY